MKALSLLIALSILAVSPVAHAIVGIEELKPDNLGESPFALDIRSERLADGQIQFTVIISEKWLKFPRQVGTSLDYIRVTTTSQEVSLIRLLPSERKADTIKCVFTISDKELNDPHAYFAFSWMSESGLESGTVCYARLKNFMKP